MGNRGNSLSNLVRRYEAEMQLVRLWHRERDNIKINLKEIKSDVLDWTYHSHPSSRLSDHSAEPSGLVI
jgi:hypothetical protein